MKFTVLVFTTFCLLFSGCSTGHCRRSGGEVLKKVDAKPPAGYEQEDLGSITVAKSDGSVQCENRSGMSLERMATSDLKGVQIISSYKRHDGLMRIQTCGAGSGMMNAYEIKHQDLIKAQKKGFQTIKVKAKDKKQEEGKSS